MKFEQEVINFTNVMPAYEKAGSALGKEDSVFDFSAVKRVDSAAIAMVLALMRKAEKLNMTVEFKGAPVSFMKLEKLYGLTKILPTEN